MSATWNTDDLPQDIPISAAGWLRVVLKGGLLGLVTFGSLAVLLLVRLIERPLWGQHRPWTPFITQFVCRLAFVILGIRFHAQGRLMQHRGAVVANHSSWLDIFALNATKRIYFVSKDEVADWPAIGWLARATGTVFIRRNARDARRQQEIFEERLNVGHKLLFFPEGTSTDGCRVLPFKSSLFQAFFKANETQDFYVQPVTVVYQAPLHQDPRFYGWWGEMEFVPHLLKVLAAPRQGAVTLIYHEPRKVADYADRKTLALDCEAQVRRGLELVIS